jgi:hypothetical protein
MKKLGTRTCVARSDNAAASTCASTSWYCPINPSNEAACKYVITPSEPWHANRLAIDPRGGREDVVASASSSTIKVSIDGGVTWKTSVTPSGGTHSVYFDDAGYLYATTPNGIYRCTQTLPSSSAYCPNYGDWSPFGLNSATPRYITGFRKAHPSGADPTYWAATTSGLYRKTPTQDWTLVTGGGGYTVNEVETIPGHGNCVYAALGFVGGHVQHRGGVRFSSDNGANWNAITLGAVLHSVPISDLVVHPTDAHKMSAASFGRGFWSYDWGNALPAACGGP